MTEIILLVTAMLSMVAVFSALVVTAFIFYRTKQDIAEVGELRRSLTAIGVRADEADYISDQIVNVLYDLYGLIAWAKAYIELKEQGYAIDEKLFRDVNRRVSLIEKHFAEVGLFSQDEERRKSVQMSLANMYGDGDTLRIMRKIVDGEIGKADQNIGVAMKMLEARLRANKLYVNSTSWTGRPSGGAF